MTIPDYYCIDMREESLNVYQEAHASTSIEFVQVDTFKDWLKGAFEEELSLIESEEEESS